MENQYTADQLHTLVGKAWVGIVEANAGVCENLGWGLRVMPHLTAIVIKYTDCDRNTQYHRIIL